MAEGLIVVDIDDTILSSRRRKHRVLADMGINITYEEAMAKSVERGDFGGEEVKRRFYERFDSGDYLIYDEPLPGASRALREVRMAGVCIAYVTNRHEYGSDSMKPGTLKTLKIKDFPVPDGRDVHLLMKPEKGMDRRTSKLAIVNTISQICNIHVGVGDLPEDAEIYRTCGLLPVILRHGKYKKEDFPEGVFVFENWDQIGGKLKGIYFGKSGIGESG